MQNIKNKKRAESVESMESIKNAKVKKSAESMESTKNKKATKNIKNIKNLGEIYRFLDSISPFNLAESWDNSGLLIGDFNARIEKIALSLDISETLALNLEPNSLLITHHPLIFTPLKNLNFSTFPSKIIEILIKKNISLIAMHTNFDKTHLNESFTQILGFKKYKKEDLCCFVKCDFEFEKLVKNVKKRLNIATLKVSESKRHIKKIAIVCGAGIGEICDLLENSHYAQNMDAQKTKDSTKDSKKDSKNTNAKNDKNALDCVITGDVKYHDAFKLQNLGISIIDVGHYESERHFGAILAPYLKKIHYNAIILDSQNPFSYKE